jgi:hypothetical protein
LPSGRRALLWSSGIRQTEPSRSASFVIALIAAIGLADTRSLASVYAIDNGGGGTSVALGVSYSNATNQAVFLNTFSLAGGDTAINQISISFGLPGLSELLRLGFTAQIYSDANGGTPWGGTIVWSGSGTITSLSDTLVDVAVPDTGVASSFAVGFLFTALSNGLYYPAAVDLSAPLAGRSYVAFTGPDGTLDLNNLGAAPNIGAVEPFPGGFNGNFMIRANGIPAPGAFALLGLAGLARRRRR